MLNEPKEKNEEWLRKQLASIVEAMNEISKVIQSIWDHLVLVAKAIYDLFVTLRNNYEHKRAWKNWDSEGIFIDRKALKHSELPKGYSTKARLEGINYTERYRRNRSRTFTIGYGTITLAAFVSFGLGILIASPSPAEAVELNTYASNAQVYTSPNTTRTIILRDTYVIKLYSLVQWPTSDHDITPGLGNFGIRHCRGCSLFHKGDDFNPGGGTPVEVVSDGVVISSGWAGALGESVAVLHSINGVTTVTRYGHMQSGSLRVTPGQKIKRGTVLGLVGDTGASTGNHLHFQVEIGGEPIDPMPWLLANVNS